MRDEMLSHIVLYGVSMTNQLAKQWIYDSFFVCGFFPGLEKSEEHWLDEKIK